MHQDLKKYLSLACKDLLIFSAEVTFLHRTVYTFLTQKDQQRKLDEGAPSTFLDGRIVHLLNLARPRILLDLGQKDKAIGTIGKTVEMSLSVPHVDFCEQYMQAFDEVLLRTTPVALLSDGKH